LVVAVEVSGERGEFGYQAGVDQKRKEKKKRKNKEQNL